MSSLKNLRIENGVSQVFLAKKLGIHRTTLMSYEIGRTHPPKSIYYQLAHVFRLPVESVLSLSENAKVHP